MSLTHKKMEHLKAFGQAVACSSVMRPADLQSVESLASASTPRVALLSRSSLQCGNSTPSSRGQGPGTRTAQSAPYLPGLATRGTGHLAHTALDMEWVSRGAAKCHC